MLLNGALLNQALLNGSLQAEITLELSEGIQWADVITAEQVTVLLETLYMSDSLLSSAILEAVSTDTIEFLDDLFVAFSYVLSEGILLADATSETVLRVVSLIEALQFADVISSNHTANLLAAESLGIYDALYRYFERTASETVLLEDTLLNSMLAAHLLVEGCLINDTIAPTLVLYASSLDGFKVADTLSTSAILKTALEDGFTFITSFIHDGDSYTGWVMNSENFAVTTYDNYQFNSLCKFNDKYYGAQSDGVYLLEGARDGATRYINAVIRTGKMDLGTSNLKNINQCYLGFTGDGNIVLKVITDNDIECWYNLASTDSGLHTDRLSLAKGPIGRYWQFEIVTQQNTDLELDSIELFPIVLKRKV